MWNGNGKTFPLSSSTENNLKAVLIKNPKHINYQNNIKFIENAKVNSNKSRNSNAKKCTDRISIDMEILMQKKCLAHHSA